MGSLERALVRRTGVFFLCRRKAWQPGSEGFRGKSIGILWNGYAGVSEEVGLKKCEEIMIACFKIAGGIPEFKFPPPTWKKIGPFMRKLVGFFRYFLNCLYMFGIL